VTAQRWSFVVSGTSGFSDESCKLWITGDLFFCNSACLHLAFVNMDAFLRLKDPRHRRGRRVVTACSLLLWIGAPWSVSFVQVCLQVSVAYIIRFTSAKDVVYSSYYVSKLLTRLSLSLVVIIQCVHKNRANYFLSTASSNRMRSNFWHNDLRSKCQSGCDYVFHLTCVMPIPSKAFQRSYILAVAATGCQS